MGPCEWTWSRKIFMYHVNIHKRTSTSEKILNNLWKNLLALYMPICPCPWPSQLLAQITMSRVAGSEAMPECKGMGSTSYIVIVAGIAEYLNLKQQRTSGSLWYTSHLFYHERSNSSSLLQLKLILEWLSSLPQDKPWQIYWCGKLNNTAVDQGSHFIAKEIIKMNMCP